MGRAYVWDTPVFLSVLYVLYADAKGDKAYYLRQHMQASECEVHS